MATPEIFLDTAGVLALWDSRDEHHKHAVKIQQEAARKKRRFVTTDYILDESVTLLLVRHSHPAASDFIDTIEKTGFLKVEWSTSEKFFAATSLFRKHDDKDWSFTDCVSFVTMKELKLRDAFTSDHQFEEAGYVPLLLKKPTL